MGIVASPLRPPREQVRRFEAYRTPEIADACEDPSVLSGITPVHPSMRLLGCAVTVKMYPRDNLTCHLALKRARGGDVLIIGATGQSEGAPWGQLMTENASRKNLAGVVVDGPVRDRDALIEGDFPVFCRGFDPRGTRKQAVGELNTPIECGDENTRVQPGDVVVGDANGVVVVPPGRVESVATKAAKIRSREEELTNRVRRGEDLFELMELGAITDREPG